MGELSIKYNVTSVVACDERSCFHNQCTANGLKGEQGSLLIEAMLSIAVFFIIATATIGVFLHVTESSKQSVEYVAATGLLQEGIEAVRSIRNREYSELVNGSHGLQTASGYYEFSGTSETIGSFTRTITVEDVYRNSGLTGDIDTSGTLDSSTKKITVNVYWNTLASKTQNINAVFYVYNFSTSSWTQTATSDFSIGSQNSAAITATSNGEVQLRSAQVDWNGLVVQHDVDMAGNGNRNAFVLDETQDLLYVLSDTGSGDELEVYDVSDVSESMPTSVDSYPVGYDGADMVLNNGYLYIATNDDSNEVVVLDAYDLSYVQSLDLTGGANAVAIAATGTTLVVARDKSGSSSEVSFWDITDPEGTINELGVGSGETGRDMTALAMDSNYVYVTSTKESEELFVYRLSDYTKVYVMNMSDDNKPRSLALVGNNLYVGRDNGGGKDDFYLLDVSSPETSITEISSEDTGTDVYGIHIDDNEDYAFLATTDDAEELVVIDLSTFTVAQTGNTNNSSNANDVVQYGGYVYLATDSDSADLVVFRTDEGGWGTPSLVGSDDKDGSHDPNEIFVDNGFAYMATEQNKTYDELFIWDVSTPSSPSLQGSFDVGDHVRDIWVSGDYTYLATANNSRELDVIYTASKSSPCRVATFDATGNQDGYTVTVSGDNIYLGRKDSTGSGRYEFYVIDGSTLPTSCGSTVVLTSLGGVDFNDRINDLVVSGTNVYAATDDNSAEMAIFDVSSPGSGIPITSYDLSGSADGDEIDISGTTVALGRASSGKDELVMIDVSGAPALLGSDNVGDSVNCLKMYGTDEVVIGVNTNNSEFQYWDTSNPSTPAMVSSYDLNADASGCYFDGTSAFMATKHDSSELQIIQASSAPSNYALNGSFTSQPYDSGASTTSWGAIEWSESGVGSLTFRIRTASSQAGLSTAKWVGSDGTADTTYSASGSSIITDPGTSGTQWFQWKAFMTGSGSATPILEDVTVSYTQ